MATSKRAAHRRAAPVAARRKLVYLSVIGALATTAALVAPTAVDARITKVTVTSKESPTFGGYSWPGVGQYERLAGMAYGEIDPNDPRNAVITDIKLAPRNANGKVEYSHTFYIMKPIDLSKGNHKLMYDVVNRGAPTFGVLNRGLGANDSGAVTDPQTLSNTFLLPKGYTIAYSGWDASAGTDPAGFNQIINLPVAKNPDGSAITGPAYEYIVSSAASVSLTYAAATLDKSQAKLTHRVHLDDAPQVVPASGWQYNAGGTAISLVGSNFVGNDIYEFSYTAKNPTVNGIGFAALRDFITWIKYEAMDDFANANPLAGDVTRVYTINRSQPARTLNDFRTLGFNASEGGRKVIDGMLNWVGASSGINMNYRFSNPGTTQRNRQDQLYTEAFFPFANESTTDPISGMTAGRYDKCTASNTCPFAMEVYSSNEYWVKAASLMHTNPQGTADLPGHPMARLYLISSHQHSNPGNVNSKGSCQQFGNPLASEPVQRALWEAMDQWITKGVEPPPSMVPHLADGTLVPPLPQEAAGFPKIPGVTYTGLKSTRYRFNYGPNFYATGVPTIYPPVVSSPMFDNPANGPIYPSFVPKTDVDGNEIAGIRLPDVRVPIRTYSGWSLRSGAWANDGCEGSGQSIAFPTTKAARTASGDPRLSIEERYPNFLDYYYKVSKAINDMVGERFLLPEDSGTAMNRMLNA
ncbi:MAG: alpha/beta hydrolase domain-containing protein, partial [Casimicrobiaceae bacterium]